jgi:hypothetical protein
VRQAGVDHDLKALLRELATEVLAGLSRQRQILQAELILARGIDTADDGDTRCGHGERSAEDDGASMFDQGYASRQVTRNVRSRERCESLKNLELKLD